MKKLEIFDFDQTLFETPSPEDGNKIYDKNFTNKNWWESPESLNLDVLEIKPIKSILSKFKKSVDDKNSIVIILTARKEKLRSEIEKILNKYKLEPDELILKNGDETKGD